MLSTNEEVRRREKGRSCTTKIMRLGWRICETHVSRILAKKSETHNSFLRIGEIEGNAYSAEVLGRRGDKAPVKSLWDFIVSEAGLMWTGRTSVEILFPGKILGNASVQRMVEMNAPHARCKWMGTEG